MPLTLGPAELLLQPQQLWQQQSRESGLEPKGQGGTSAQGLARARNPMQADQMELD